MLSQLATPSWSHLREDASVGCALDTALLGRTTRLGLLTAGGPVPAWESLTVESVGLLLLLFIQPLNS